MTSPTKRRYVPDTADMDVVKKIKANEIELRDRNTVLRGIKQNVCLLLEFPFSLGLNDGIQNFSGVKTAFAEKLKKLKEAGKSGNQSTGVSSSGIHHIFEVNECLISFRRSQIIVSQT